MPKILLEIIKMFASTKKAQAAPPTPAPAEPEIKSTKKMYITLNDWITSSGRYPDRAKSPELTQEIKQQAQITVDCVNNLLNEIAWQEEVSISSGFRPSSANAAAGGAKKSAHMTGLALDIFQSKPINKLGQAIRARQKQEGEKGILGRNGLMMEALEVTVGANSLWVHLDRVKRSVRPSMEFKP
jgi:hypothetical protein